MDTSLTKLLDPPPVLRQHRQKARVVLPERTRHRDQTPGLAAGPTAQVLQQVNCKREKGWGGSLQVEELQETRGKERVRVDASL